MTEPSRPHLQARVARWSLIVALGAGALTVLGALADPRRALVSYLTAFAAALSTALGALTMVMIAYLTSARWFVVLRRVAETIAATLPVLALLWLPILIGMRILYPWAGPRDALDPLVRESVLAKRTYLNVPFFVVRAIVYFASWSALAIVLRRLSLRQDARPDPALARRVRAVSAAGAPILAITLTFASFDWLMSLSPSWSSTIYGLYFFAGGFVAALALVAVLVVLGGEEGGLGGIVTVEHGHALAKLLLTFLIFWAYMGFSQILVIWIADVPEEGIWLISREHGSWLAIGLLLLLGHFALPFLLLLTRTVKLSLRALAALGGWLLVMHYVDVYWLVMPELTPTRVTPHWLDLTSLATVVGVAVALGLRLLRGGAIVPTGDPDLAASLRYESP